MKTLFPFLAFWTLLSVSFASAQQPNCGPIEELEKVLANKYQEIPVMVGAMEGGIEMKFFGNPKTGTFTILMINNKTACVAAAGEGLEFALPPKTPQGEPM